jgi:hypothetical protein
VHRWEFVNAPSSTREHWRWRKKDASQNLLLESGPFNLFLNCLADARMHGFDLGVHEFQLISEPD